MTIKIGHREIGSGCPVYLVAEMSANHHHSLDGALRTIEAAAQAGADAIKVQTYTPDTLTIDCDEPWFQVGQGTIWAGRTLYDLYREAYMPWEWQPALQEKALSLGLDWFSTPFDETAVEYLAALNVPAFKIASFEINDHGLLRAVAMHRKPVILSTGMANEREIEEALEVLQANGNPAVVLLKCTSAYPSPPGEMNLRAIPYLADRFGVPAGLSDHTLGTTVAIAATALGACVIEKHFTLSRAIPGPDSAFSLEPQEFHQLVESVRTVEEALGSVSLGVGATETGSTVFRRSLFVVDRVKKGEPFTAKNVRSIRPGYGLAPKHIASVLGKMAASDIDRGTPLDWDLVTSHGA